MNALLMWLADVRASGYLPELCMAGGALAALIAVLFTGFSEWLAGYALRLYDTFYCIFWKYALLAYSRWLDWRTDRVIRRQMRVLDRVGELDEIINSEPLPRHSVMGEMWINIRSREDVQ